VLRSQVLSRVLSCVTTAKQVQFSEPVLTAGNECVGVLLAGVEPSGRLLEAVLTYGLDQLGCCRACGPDYHLAVLSLVTLVLLHTSGPSTCPLPHDPLPALSPMTLYLPSPS